jgi:hypothetical protein
MEFHFGEACQPRFAPIPKTRHIPPLLSVHSDLKQRSQDIALESFPYADARTRNVATVRPPHWRCGVGHHRDGIGHPPRDGPS